MRQAADEDETMNRQPRSSEDAEGRAVDPGGRHDRSRPDDSEHPRGWTVAECQDRLEVESRLVRRHFWRRLLPGVGITSYAAVSIALGADAPVVILTAMFGLFTVREAAVFRRNLHRLRDVELELASLTAGGTPVDAEADAGSGPASPGVPTE